jgi:lipopolysaccharide biosynthesis glycosyltransferase
MATNPIPVAFAINDPYLKPLLVVLVSMFEHAHADTVYAVHVINYRLKPQTKHKIEELVSERHPQSSVTFLDLSDEQWQQVPAVGGFYGKEANYRLLLPDLLPNVERIIYMDVDVLVLCDLTELFTAKMHGLATFFVRDAFSNYNSMERTAKLADFFNFNLKFNENMVMIQAGVLLIELDVWRKLNWVAEGLAILNTAPPSLLKYPDQAVLNYLTLRDKQYGVTLPWVFNIHPHSIIRNAQGKLVGDSKSYHAFSTAAFVCGEEWQQKEEVQIIHFAGNAPWKVENRGIGLRDLYIKYASKIGWTL